MISPKNALLCAALTLASSPAFADATMVDVAADYETGKVFSAKMDSDAKAHLYSIAIGNFGVVDKALGTSDADYEVVLAERGMLIGAAMYGQYDAGYDAFVTPANFFETAALGRYDAGYETALAARGTIVGAALYGQHDAGYDAFLTPANFFETAALGAHDADYEAPLQSRGVFVGKEVFGHNDADYEPVLFPTGNGCVVGEACF